MEKDKEIEELKRNGGSNSNVESSEIPSEELQRQLQQLNDEILHLNQDLSSQREENDLKSSENAKLQDALIKINSEYKSTREKLTELQGKCKQLIQQYKVTSEQLNNSSQFTSIALRAAYEVGLYCIQQQMESTANKSQLLGGKPKNSKAPVPIQWLSQKRKTSTKAF